MNAINCNTSWPSLFMESWRAHKEGLALHCLTGYGDNNVRDRGPRIQPEPRSPWIEPSVGAQKAPNPMTYDAVFASWHAARN